MPAHGTTSVNYTTNAIPPGTNDGLRPGFKRQVATDNILVTWVAGGSMGTTTVSSFAHGLGYTPLIEVSINHANVIGSIVLNDVSIPIPTGLAITTGTSLAVGFPIWVEAWVDSTNLYLITWAANGAPGGTLIYTYYLYQQAIPVL